MTNAESFNFYLPGQIVEVKRDNQWIVGIVTKATSVEYGWTQVVIKEPDCEIHSMPGYKHSAIRLASDAVVNGAPDYVQQFIANDRLNRENPPIPHGVVTSKTMVALSTIGIKRYGSLKKANDADLMQLKGVGKKAIVTLRQWQVEIEELLEADSQLAAMAAP